MKERNSPTVKMIEKLNALLPTLTEDEAKVARYQIERLSEENPFLGAPEKASRTLLECWESRDITRRKILDERLAREKKLLQGYKVILRTESTENVLRVVEYTQKKIYFITKELDAIERFLLNALPRGMRQLEDRNTPKSSGARKETVQTAESPSAQAQKESEKELETLGAPKNGKANFLLSSFTSCNPQHKNCRISVYVDGNAMAEVEADKLGTGEIVSLEFRRSKEIEIAITSGEDVLMGWLFFHVSDLLPAVGMRKKEMFYTIGDKSTLVISVGECVFEHEDKLKRNEVALISCTVSNHTMRKIDNMVEYQCGFCEAAGKAYSSNIYYRCTMCKFTCHMSCLCKLFFECVKYLHRKKEEEERARMEEKIERIKQGRVAMIKTVVKILEKPNDERMQDSTARSIADKRSSMQCTPFLPTKRYNVEHMLEKKKVFGMSWCYHCGERLGIFSVEQECTVCGHTFHNACRSSLFASCGVTEELLLRLMQIQPKREKEEDETIELSEFKFLHLLGKGTFAIVYLCEWRGEKVALKAIAKKKIIAQNAAAFVEAERKCLELVSKSKNPFLAQLRGNFQTKTHVFFVVEFLSGGDLYHHMLHSVLEPRTLQVILAEIVLGLEWLHKNNIIYRDLKPENVMFTADGHIKLTDFGLCAIGRPRGVFHTFCGTIDSVAPEVIDGQYTSCADWWSLGVLAYKLVLKKSPFDEDSPEEMFTVIQNDMPADMNRLKGPIHSLIEGLLVKNPEKRLGAKSVAEIKKHEYFHGIDWGLVAEKKVPTGWQCSTQLEANFDQQYTKQSICNFKVEDEPVSALEDAYFQNF